MANPLWTYNVSLQGATPNNKANLRFILQYDDDSSPMDLAAALTAAGQIKLALIALTSAFVSKETLTWLMSADNQVPTNGADCTDEAVIMVHLNEPTDLPKLHALRVPAPINPIWMPDGETLNIENLLVRAFVNQVAQHAFVSDAEQINTSAGTNGIDSGHKRSRAKSFRKR